MNVDLLPMGKKVGQMINPRSYHHFCLRGSKPFKSLGTDAFDSGGATKGKDGGGGGILAVVRTKKPT